MLKYGWFRNWWFICNFKYFNKTNNRRIKWVVNLLVFRLKLSNLWKTFGLESPVFDLIVFEYFVIYYPIRTYSILQQNTTMKHILVVVLRMTGKEWILNFWEIWKKCLKIACNYCLRTYTFFSKNIWFYLLQVLT